MVTLSCSLLFFLLLLLVPFYFHAFEINLDYSYKTDRTVFAQVWLILPDMITYVSIHFPANGITSSSFVVEEYSSVYIYHILFILFPSLKNPEHNSSKNVLLCEEGAAQAPVRSEDSSVESGLSAHLDKGAGD